AAGRQGKQSHPARSPPAPGLSPLYEALLYGACLLRLWNRSRELPLLENPQMSAVTSSGWLAVPRAGMPSAFLAAQFVSHITGKAGLLFTFLRKLLKCSSLGLHACTKLKPGGIDELLPRPFLLQT